MITLLPVPAKPKIVTSGNQVLCPTSSGIIYSVNRIAGQTYTWHFSGTNAIITSGAGTDSITVNYKEATNGVWTVTPSNSCGYGPKDSVEVTFTTAPPEIGEEIITDNQYPCATSTGVVYSVTPAPGVTYDWSFSGENASIQSGGRTSSISVDYAAATNGTWTVIPTNSCGVGKPVFLNIDFKLVPASSGSITGSTVLEADSYDNEYWVAAIPGNEYSWSYDGTGVTIEGSGNRIQLNLADTASSGTLRVLATNECGQGLPSVLPIEVKPKTVTSLEESSSSNVDIFPNPSTREFLLKLPIWFKTAEVRIMNAAGDVVHEVNISGDHFFDLGSHSKGLYIILIQHESLLITKKILIR